MFQSDNVRPPSKANPAAFRLPIGLSAVETVFILVVLVIQEVDRLCQPNPHDTWFTNSDKPGYPYLEAFIDSIVLGTCFGHGILAIVTYFDAKQFSDICYRVESAIAVARLSHMQRLERMIATDNVGIITHH